VGLGEVHLEADGLLELDDALVQPALLAKGCAQVGVDLGGVLLEADDFLDFGDGLVQPALS
jgi:hypothetical protein